MSGTTLRILITLVLLVHRVGHVMGAMPALGLFDDERRSGQGWLGNWSSRSWLLTELLGDTAARVVCVILYGAALIGVPCPNPAVADQRDPVAGRAGRLQRRWRRLERILDRPDDGKGGEWRDALPRELRKVFVRTRRPGNSC